MKRDKFLKDWFELIFAVVGLSLFSACFYIGVWELIKMFMEMF